VGPRLVPGEAVTEPPNPQRDVTRRDVESRTGESPSAEQEERQGRGSAPARASATRTPMDTDRKLSEEGRAYAETVGVTDVDRVFRDFVHHYLSEAKMSADWEAMWRRWCDRELRIQRAERERNRAFRRAPIQVDPSGSTRGWTMPAIIYPPKKKAVS
jgi:hypothetical protein